MEVGYDIVGVINYVLLGIQFNFDHIIKIKIQRKHAKN